MESDSGNPSNESRRSKLALPISILYQRDATTKKYKYKIMDNNSGNPSNESPRSKLARIVSFVESSLGQLDNVGHFLERIRNINADSIPADEQPFIDVLIRLISDMRGVSTLPGENLRVIGLIVIVIRFLRYVCLRREVHFICTILYDSFLKIILNAINTNTTLVSENTDMPMRRMIYGIVEKIEKIDNLIDAFELEEQIDEGAELFLNLHVDIHVGIEAIGELKLLIKNWTGAKDDPEKCLQYLNLFVKLSTMRYALIMRFKFFLESKKCDRSWSSILHRYIEKEREDAQKFLKFFSNPSLENVGILAAFDASEHKELATFLREMQIPIADLSEDLNGGTFVIKSIRKPSLAVGRAFSLFRTVRGMNASIDNVRIKFKFKAVENLSNVFHIESPDVGEFLIMNENACCKYLKGYHGHGNAQWRVILICQQGEDDEIRSTFIFCTRKWPGKFFYLEESYWIPAVGLKDGVKPDTECLFTLLTADGLPLSVQKPSPVKMAKKSDDNQYMKIQENAMVTAKSSNTRPEQLLSFQIIQAFLEMKSISVSNDIERIKIYFLENENAPLNAIVGRIAESTKRLHGDTFDEGMLMGLVDMISINHHIFRKKIRYGSILLQILRVCGLVMSCIWMTREIETLICSRLENDEEHWQRVAKNVGDLKSFAAHLSKIERTEHIPERIINEMVLNGKFCEEMECLSGLKEKAWDDPNVVLTCLQLSILQQTILWQMYTVAKQPGHSDETANHLYKVLHLQIRNDIDFIKKFLISSKSESSIADRYLSCLPVIKEKANLGKLPVTEEKVILGKLPVTEKKAILGKLPVTEEKAILGNKLPMTLPSWIRNLPIKSELELICLRKIDDLKCKKMGRR